MLYVSLEEGQGVIGLGVRCRLGITALALCCRTQEDLRVDGRGCEDYRCVEVETDVVSNTSGSARVKLVSAVAIARAHGRNG